MMKPEEFTNMSNTERLKALIEDGHELMGRIYLNYIIKLFKLHNFYVEVWYRQLSNSVDKIMVVNMDDVIHLYEQQIDITDLFK